MKHIYSLLICLAVCLSAFSQSLPKVIGQGGGIAPFMEQPSPGGAFRETTESLNDPLSFRALETQIGITRFELQTGASLGRRIATFDGGKVSAIWLFGLDENGGWPDRGTAYNHFNGTEWGPEPTGSLEVLRSGYPSFTKTPNDLEVVFSHKNTTDTTWFLQTYTKMPEETDWNETEIPSAVPGGPVWAKIGTGGPDGNTIHGVAVSVAPDFGGAIYEGMNQHPLYCRSTDNGETWDMADVILPGLDSNYYIDIFGGAYNMDAWGETVAIGLFDSWGDIAVMKSVDNGVTWTKTIVNDFPLDKYDGSGYGPDDIPFDPNAPDSVSIFTADYSGSVLVDNDGKVHVFFGQMYVSASGASRFLDLATDGIAYWNEDFGPDSIQTIAYMEDFSGDSLITITGNLANLRYTNAGLTTFPSSGIDSEGNLYLVYSAMREDITLEDQNYRHVFIIKSEDGGETWSEPYDLINPEVTDFPEFTEAVYPSIPARIDDAVHLIYQQDFTPGPTTSGLSPDQNIIYVKVDKNTFGMISAAEEIPELESDIRVVPNPADDMVQISFELKENSSVHLYMFNLLGEQTGIDYRKNYPPGLHAETLDVSRLEKGVYFLQLMINGKGITKKVLVQ